MGSEGTDRSCAETDVHAATADRNRALRSFERDAALGALPCSRPESGPHILQLFLLPLGQVARHENQRHCRLPPLPCLPARCGPRPPGLLRARVGEVWHGAGDERHGQVSRYAGGRFGPGDESTSTQRLWRARITSTQRRTGGYSLNAEPYERDPYEGMRGVRGGPRRGRWFPGEGQRQVRGALRPGGEPQ